MLSRRKFLIGSAITGALATSPALALTSGTIAAPSGKILIGGFDSTGLSYGFENLFKLSVNQSAAAPFVFPAVMDTNGFPNNAPNNTLPTAINAQMSISPAWGTVRLVISWLGRGGIAVGGVALSKVVITGKGVTNQSSGTLLQVLGTNVRITFNFTTAPLSTQYTWGFPPGTYNGMSNLILCRQSNEAAVLANENLFNPDFITLQKALNPKIIRALDWSGANLANITSLSQRAPPGAVTFRSDRFVPSAWAGAVSGIDTYTIAAPSGWTGLVDGAVVQFYVPSRQVNTVSPPTLNVAGSGAINMTDNGPNNIAIGALVASSGGNTQVWTATYSAIYNYWITTPGGLNTAVPLEQHIALANAINAHLWYNISHRYPPSEGTAIANLVNANLNLQLNFYPELSNEVWNSVTPETTFILNIGTTLGITAANNENLQFGYGLLVRQMMGAIAAAWGGPRPRLRRVMAFQAQTGDFSGNNTYRFQGVDIATIAQGGKVANTGPINTLWRKVYGAPNYTASPNRPIDFCDVMSYATYYTGGQVPGFNTDPPWTNAGGGLSTGGPSGWTTGVLGAADAFAAGGSTNIANALAFLDWDIRQGTFNGVAGGGTLLAFNGTSNGAGVYASWESIAAVYDSGRPGIGLTPLTVECYEGAYSCSGPTIPTCTTIGIDKSYGGIGGKIDNLLTAYKSTELFAKLVNDMHNQFHGTATGLPNFGLLSHSTTFGWLAEQGSSQWSLLPGDTYTGPTSLGPFFRGTPFKSWDALVAINH